MTPTQRNAMQAALDALGSIHPGNMTPLAERNWFLAADSLRAALAEPVVEPVALVKWQVGGLVVHIVGDVKEGAALYTSPPTNSII